MFGYFFEIAYFDNGKKTVKEVKEKNEAFKQMGTDANETAFRAVLRVPLVDRGTSRGR